jgi:hypothetical protein
MQFESEQIFDPRVEIRLRILFGPPLAAKTMLIFFSLSRRFSLDIDVAGIYTFFNCNLICRIDATHRKGRIGKWQPRKQPRNQRRRQPRKPPRRPPRKSSCSYKPKGNTQGGCLKASPLVFLGEEKEFDVPASAHFQRYVRNPRQLRLSTAFYRREKIASPSGDVHFR